MSKLFVLENKELKTFEELFMYGSIRDGSPGVIACRAIVSQLKKDPSLVDTRSGDVWVSMSSEVFYSDGIYRIRSPYLTREQAIEKAWDGMTTEKLVEMLNEIYDQHEGVRSV